MPDEDVTFGKKNNAKCFSGKNPGMPITTRAVPITKS